MKISVTHPSILDSVELDRGWKSAFLNMLPCDSVVGAMTNPV